MNKNNNKRKTLQQNYEFAGGYFSTLLNINYIVNLRTGETIKKLVLSNGLKPLKGVEYFPSR
jgi:hypothetical protein